MNVADAVVVLILAVLVFLGVRRGLIGQCLLLAATLVSLLVAAVTAYLVATEVEAGSGLARLAAPLAFFVALALASWLSKLVARGLTRIIHGLPFSTIDRLAGALVAVAAGVIITSLLILGLVSIPQDNPLTTEAMEARLTPVLLWSGGEVAALCGRHLTFIEPFAHHYEAALERIHGTTDIL